MSLHVVFKVAGAEYALAAADVLHMETFTGATRVPGAPPHVVGLMQIRRRVVPIVDMRIRFGLPPVAPTLDSRVVVVQDGARAVGLLADSAREVMNLSEEQFSAPPEIVARESRDFVRSIAQSGLRLVMLLDFRKVIGEEKLHVG
jgi:purine-binding chemotaxis protein CheW